MKKLNKLIIACGGTGGHFYPGLSIAIEVKKRGGTPLLLLSGKHSEEQKLKALEYNIESEIIPAPPVPTGLLEKIDYSKTCAVNIVKILMILNSFKPDAILLMGSYTSVAAGLASTAAKVPMFIHDGNALVGKANIFLSRFAIKMALSFPAVNAKKIMCDYEMTGMPLREEILETKGFSKEQAISNINSIFSTNFNTTSPLLLIFGGSQGALKINDLIPPALEMLKDKDFQVIHLAGNDKIKETKARYANFKKNKLILESTDKMNLLYPAADLVISRSGGSTIAELSIFGKYAILAPYPYASDNHQRENAEYYASTGAGTVVTDTEFTITKIQSLLASFFENPQHFVEEGKKSAKIASPHAAKKVVDMIEISI
ncbi:MAG TPA: UDP-N-acetylglucosamine--N-acetylmuramyl-(pentapeptide) pyrophosphoryl-undecaprenol N-acetylglucosamine transferase [Victivallales bacterium]|nr:UDP-N-acetylglucosamine--N-acetylmuramyl-(pentapeptide) pyrophosphoryl-undecaprenol N-acetylglucosamine transferase [Victivallales bacterium]HRR28799.1 UDP-N-acetylglucosamine--N-acetylmuramyl-(pentapeptide) pyrophosphoryl-undecaprenol N-acetylglucosamine transferase [Victivallales bacterium]HRU02139.1 UDP-N-acetylglucosamine--N-acetylmuramyl-(pentapeptide) pyrophosphoryl-undecaprenol N-acetylglucosamine transferase [Victivallales bacterium]